MRHELLRLRPAELLLPDGTGADAILDGLPGARTPLPAWKFEPGHARNVLLNISRWAR